MACIGHISYVFSGVSLGGITSLASLVITWKGKVQNGYGITSLEHVDAEQLLDPNGFNYWNRAVMIWHSPAPPGSLNYWNRGVIVGCIAKECVAILMAIL